MMKHAILVGLLVGAVFAQGPAPTANAGDCCQPVCCVPPPPPPVEVSWCVEDPCTCCKYTVSACLPACCRCEIPVLVCWKNGLLGRKILTYKFACGECVEVVITKHGKAFTR